MAPTRFYIALFFFFLAALVVGFLYFLNGMGNASYLISNGISYGLHFFDKPRYDVHVQGIIFTLTFLAAAVLMLIMMMLPDQRLMEARAQASAPPQPRQRPTPTQQTAPQPQMQQQPVQQTIVEPAPAAVGGAPVQTVTAVEEAQGGGASAPTQAITSAPSSRAEPKPSIEQELLVEPADEFLDDIPDGRYDAGEEDVVYGNGRVTDDSVWEFIHNYPDSAVKFLYRKTLENKALTPTEEDIYRKWELRGMTRTKVRQFMLEIMGWQSLPDDFPHNIWKFLRDQIFEIKSRLQA